MSDDGYSGGGNAGTKWGCLGGALIGAPIFMFLLIGEALGDCIEGDECKNGFVLGVLLPSAAIAGLVFLLIRWAVNEARRNNPDD